MARKFLYVFAVIIALVIAAAIAFKLNPGWFMRAALVPTVEFHAPPAAEPNAWADPKSWIARPDMDAESPALWLPRTQTGRFPVEAERGDTVVFFIHPTSYLSRAQWNAPFTDEEANWRADLFTRGQASAFAGAGEVWAPRYRQAAIGAFLTNDVGTANQALDAAYRDVVLAFDQFLQEIDPKKPIILAGHSQGALHLVRLMRERVAPNPELARRIVAAYPVGWPISVEHDLPLLGLPACETAESTGCIMTWQSYAEPADPSMVMNVYDATEGFDGKPRTGSRMLCTNPITGTVNGAAEAAQNLGTVKQDETLKDGELITPSTVGARCDDPAQGGRGLLLIGEGPELGGYVMPGNSYHVYDYSLFWANIREDARRRLAAYKLIRGVVGR